MSARALKILDFALLQAGWFACVLGAAAGRPWLGPIVVTAALGLHFALTPEPRRDARTLLLIVLVGVSADLILVGCGVLAFPEPSPRLGPLPLWLAALWPLFGSTFHTTLAWLQHRPGVAALLGALGGPPGYVAADRFGALELARPLMVAVPALALAWAVVLPVAVTIARRHELAPHTNGAPA